MSKILDMAQNFEQKSKQLALDTEQSLKSEFERHERFITTVLKSSEQKIERDISAQNRKMSALVLRTWLWVALSVIIAFTGCLSALWWQGKMISENWQTISEQKRTIQELSDRGGKIQLSRCGEQERLCARIDENARPYQDGYRILKGY